MMINWLLGARVCIVYDFAERRCVKWRDVE